MQIQRRILINPSLLQMSAALPGRGRNVPVCIETSKKTVLLEVTELEGTPVT